MIAEMVASESVTAEQGIFSYGMRRVQVIQQVIQMGVVFLPGNQLGNPQLFIFSTKSLTEI